MAWDEWEQLKADSAQRSSTHMQLNQLAADGGGGGGSSSNLVVNQDDLGAVGHEAHTLFEDLRTGTDIAGLHTNGAGFTMQAATSLKSHGFEIGGALELTVEVWTSQAKTVLQACAHISNHLDYSKKQHAHDDDKIAAQVRHRDGSAASVSELSKYFK
ncbi:hypothetical protein AB0H86_04840 [Streptomyces sp. NPDC050997]|uniref:hypothetical protein n=1 Tax=Streptomyces sp. NPDC050997 TaxID=3155519 RepID=UPI003415654F